MMQWYKASGRHWFFAGVFDLECFLPLFLLFTFYSYRYFVNIFYLRAHEYAKTHSFASWFVCITSCFGSMLIGNFLVNEPMIQVYANMNNMLASAIQYGNRNVSAWVSSSLLT